RLTELLPLVERGENDDERMRVHWWLAESLLALGERRAAEPHLKTALALVRERGYTHFLRLRARESPAPLLEALGRGLELETCTGALVAAGSAAEPALLEIAEGSSPAVAEAALSVLAECGGQASLERLATVARRRRALASAARAALSQVEARSRRGGHAAGGAESAGAARL